MGAAACYCLYTILFNPIVSRPLDELLLVSRFFFWEALTKMPCDESETPTLFVDIMVVIYRSAASSLLSSALAVVWRSWRLLSKALILLINDDCELLSSCSSLSCEDSCGPVIGDYAVSFRVFLTLRWDLVRTAGFNSFMGLLLRRV